MVAMAPAARPVFRKSRRVIGLILTSVWLKRVGEPDQWMLARTPPHRKFILGIESETDHLPVGEVRKLWASSALTEKDVEITRAEELYWADFLETCRRIMQPPCPVDE